MTFVRDRIVEVYFWMNGGACYDPPYSHSRIILTKITSLVTILVTCLTHMVPLKSAWNLPKHLTGIPIFPNTSDGFYFNKSHVYWLNTLDCISMIYINIEIKEVKSRTCTPLCWTLLKNNDSWTEDTLEWKISLLFNETKIIYG